MYAIIKTGGKQYRVAVGDRLKVETLNAEPGDKLELDQVLMISDNGNVQVGTPVIEGTSVSATVIGEGRGEKIKVFKMHRRQGYRRTQGHRQNYTELEINTIGGATPSDAKPKKVKTKAQPKPKPKADKSTDGDDLTKINGIGPVIAGKLHDLGYTRYAQIAALTEDEAAQINEQLNFKGRIAREEWIQQAQALIS